ncbi:MAG: SRPBCC domain-containing protein [Proteobacteria bacterium]|nr:SRPBCC domain-containing protein [Pseudomonadota bacterium]
MTGTLSVTVERDLPHPPEKVWRALTQPHLIAEWLMQNDFVPAVGHAFQFRADYLPNGALDCEVLVVEPNKRLAYTWNSKSENPAFALNSVVTFALTPSDGGTHLRVEQSGFRPDQKQAYGGAKFGWQKFLENLDRVAERLSAGEGER